MDYKVHKVNSIKDINTVSEIVNKALREDFPYKEETILSYQKDVFNKQYFIDLFKNKKNAILGAYKNKEIVGFIALKADFGGVLFIDWLAVEKKYRGKGIGSMLLQKTEQWALGNKFHYLYLFTETEKNKEFYTSRGFRYIGTHFKSWYGEDEHILEKVLKDKPFKEVFSKH